MGEHEAEEPAEGGANRDARDEVAGRQLQAEGERGEEKVKWEHDDEGGDGDGGVDVAVGMLTDVANLLPVLEGLGEKHKYYGILPPHYDVVGQALLETLALGLGDEFTPALKAAWAEIYGVIATTMIKGAKYNEKSDEEYYKGYAKPADAKGEEATKKSMVSAMDWFMNPNPQSRPLPVQF